MIDGGELDEALDQILRAMGVNLSVYTEPQYRGILDDMRVKVRELYERGYRDGWNYCSDAFHIGARIAKAPKDQSDD